MVNHEIPPLVTPRVGATAEQIAQLRPTCQPLFAVTALDRAVDLLLDTQLGPWPYSRLGDFTPDVGHGVMRLGSA